MSAQLPVPNMSVFRAINGQSLQPPPSLKRQRTVALRAFSADDARDSDDEPVYGINAMEKAHAEYEADQREEEFKALEEQYADNEDMLEAIRRARYERELEDVIDAAIKRRDAATVTPPRGEHVYPSYGRPFNSRKQPAPMRVTDLPAHKAFQEKKARAAAKKGK